MSLDVQKGWSIGGDQFLTLPVLFVKLRKGEEEKI
jgi:hypothetical protein